MEGERMKKFEIGKQYVFILNGLRLTFTCTGRNDKHVSFYNVFTKRIARKINVILDAHDKDMETVRINNKYAAGWMFSEDVA
jgi:hypothetical protein